MWRNVTGSKRGSTATEGRVQPVAAVGDFDTVRASPRGSQQAADNSKPRVLIVDESKLLSEEIRDALQKNGVQVLGIATTANGAVAALSGGIADAVIFCMRTQAASDRFATLAESKPQAPTQRAVPVVFAPGLTARERQVLRLLVAGASNKEVARRLSIRSNTVRTHVQNLLAKLRVHTRLEAVTLAMRGGLEGEENIAIHSVGP
jgi:DNA-binding NarL/FixJ family response regulator